MYCLLELRGSLSVSVYNGLIDGELWRPVNAHKELKPTLCGQRSVNVDVKKAN